MPLQKAAAYYGNARTDMLPHLPDPLGSVLDVGCGDGATGRLLRTRHPQRLVGIEINREAAEIASESYDQVVVGAAEEVLAGIAERFDTILCYDVLEHLVDPWSVLAKLARLALPGGRLHVSVPNARHFSLMVDVMLRGTFGYKVAGHRDDTHLRWFTPRDLEEAIVAAGFQVTGRSHPPLSKASAVLATVTRGKSNEFLVWQWQVLAIRMAHDSAPG